MQEHERQGAASQQDASDSLSMHSPGPSEASVARSGRGSVPLEEEPAMISFEDDIGPVTGSRGVTGAPSTISARSSESALGGRAPSSAADALLLPSQHVLQTSRPASADLSAATSSAEHALAHCLTIGHGAALCRSTEGSQTVACVWCHK